MGTIQQSQVIREREGGWENKECLMAIAEDATNLILSVVHSVDLSYLRILLFGYATGSTPNRQDSYVRILRNETFDNTVRDGKWVVFFQNVGTVFLPRHR